jgi:hypothetical protein
MPGSLLRKKFKIIYDQALVKENPRRQRGLCHDAPVSHPPPDQYAPPGVFCTSIFARRTAARRSRAHEARDLLCLQRALHGGRGQWTTHPEDCYPARVRSGPSSRRGGRKGWGGSRATPSPSPENLVDSGRVQAGRGLWHEGGGHRARRFPCRRRAPLTRASPAAVERILIPSPRILIPSPFSTRKKKSARKRQELA